MIGWWVRIFLALFIGVLVSAASYLRFKKESSSESRQYTPYVSAIYLPAYVLLYVLVFLPLIGVAETAREVVSAFFCVFLSMSVYYLLMVLLLPILRKRISSRICAMLWLLPNFLYFLLRPSSLKLPEPWLVVSVSQKAVWIAVCIWLAGFLWVLIHKVVEHINFRSEILRDSVAPTQHIRTLWENELDAVYKKRPEYELVVSKNVSSPLSIGFFARTIRVVLPEREYSDDELALIFRHEIVHLCRWDSFNKLFLVLCTAMFWFNPLMWIAMKKSAEDMELSCDETVLLNKDEKERYSYAQLLLSNAGSTRGFTTCLSADGEAMRYRLRSVINPRKARTGAVVICVSIIALVMSYGLVAIAYGDTTGADVLYPHGETGGYSLLRFEKEWGEDETELTTYVADEAALHEYLAGLEMKRISGNYEFSEYTRQYEITLSGDYSGMGYRDDNEARIALYDNIIEIRKEYGLTGNEIYYYLPEGIDWEYFDCLVIECPALNICVTGSDRENQRAEGFGLLNCLQRTTDSGTTLLFDSYVDYTSRLVRPEFEPVEMELKFSHERASDCTIKVITSYKEEGYTITLDKDCDKLTFESGVPQAKYFVHTSLYGDHGEVFDAEYEFTVSYND